VHENKTSFTALGLNGAGTAAITKPVTVTFATGSAELSQKSKKIIDTDMVPFIENNGAAYIELSGNTDSVGSHSGNMVLSQARAKVVVDYLVKEWEMPAARFKVVGYGPDRPICREDNLAAEGISIDECRTLNRSTRVSVLGK
jgi:outer membrane protein OmpA-like peptidoglycan-associated protein